MIENREWTLDDYSAMLRRRAMVILVPVVLAPFMGFLLSFAFPAKYTSTSLILVEGQKVPESMVQQQIDARLDRGLRSLAAQGMREEDLKRLDFPRLRAAQRDSATSEVKSLLILDRIADAENIGISDEEVNQEIELLSLQLREPVDTLHARLTQEGSIARIREQIRRDKTAKLLYERL